MKIGAHVSAAGGLDKAVLRAEEIGAETIQLFGSPPQSWIYKPLSTEQIQAFKDRFKSANIAPAFLHGVYLINLASQSPENLKKSTDSLISYLSLSSQIGASGVIFHVGSHKGTGFDQMLKQIVSSISFVLENTPEDAWLIIENNAGMGHHVGASFQEIGKIMEMVGNDRVKVCLDTAHTFAAGYIVTTKEGFEDTMSEFDREVGFANLVAVHANDSKTPFRSGVDRHENIGQGHIGMKGFEVILSHPAFKEVPFLLEVPGFNGKGPDKENVDILKSLRQQCEAN